MNWISKTLPSVISQIVLLLVESKTLTAVLAQTVVLLVEFKTLPIFIKEDHTGLFAKYF